MSRSASSKIFYTSDYSKWIIFYSYFFEFIVVNLDAVSPGILLEVFYFGDFGLFVAILI
jgi:hypothetical protein